MGSWLLCHIILTGSLRYAVWEGELADLQLFLQTYVAEQKSILKVADKEQSRAGTCLESSYVQKRLRCTINWDLITFLLLEIQKLVYHFIIAAAVSVSYSWGNRFLWPMKTYMHNMAYVSRR